MFNLKGLILVLIFLMFVNLNAFAKYTDELHSGISNGQIIYYSYLTKRWSYQMPEHTLSTMMNVVRYVDKEHNFYSRYVANGKEIYSPSDISHEFIYDGRLMAYDRGKNKFYELYFNKGQNTLEKKLLKLSDIKCFLGNPVIIKMTDFVLNPDDNYIATVKKVPFRRQTFLIYNNTENDYNNYLLDVKHSDRLVRTLFSTRRAKVVKYYDYYNEDESPTFFVRVKYGF